MKQSKTPIGFVGQGWIGKHYADDFENRGFTTIRYSLEDPYVKNKTKIANCRITFIAVPTPTAPSGFDDSILRDAIITIGDGNIAVIKSTTTPGLVSKLQQDFPNIYILHSPEFLVEKTAAHDAAHPQRNIIGLPIDSEMYRNIAHEVMDVLPKAPYEAIMTSLESELVKYAGNCFLYTKVLFMNALYDTVVKSGGDFEHVRQAMSMDFRIGESHTTPVHDSGRGAGGHCFIKDFEAFRNYYEMCVGNDAASKMFEAMVNYNNDLLVKSNKSLDILVGVYGSGVLGKSETHDVILE